MPKLNMNVVTLSDREGHMNLFVATHSGQTLIFPFEGKSVSGVFRIISSRSFQDRISSYNKWNLDLAPGVQFFVWALRYDTKQYLNAITWDGAVDEVRRISGIPDLDIEAIHRFIRAKFPEKAQALDQGPHKNESVLQKLLAAQQELLATQQELLRIRSEEVRIIKNSLKTLLESV